MNGKDIVIHELIWKKVITRAQYLTIDGKWKHLQPFLAVKAEE